MKRSRAAYTYDVGGNPPAKRAATSTKKASASTKKAATTSTKKASTSKETSSSETPQAAAAAAPPSQSSDDRFGKCHKVSLGPNGELMIPQILPSECSKAIEKLLLPPGWVQTIDASPSRCHTLSYRGWWENNALWLESNKKALGLNAKHWKMKEEACRNGPPLGEDDGNAREEFICIFPPVCERNTNDGDEDGEEDEDEDEDKDKDNDKDNEDGEEDEDDDGEVRGNGNKESSADKKGKDKKASTEEETFRKRLGKLASRHPEHLWVITLGGCERYRW